MFIVNYKVNGMGWKSEAGSRKPEVGSRKPEVRSQKSEVGGQKSKLIFLILLSVVFKLELSYFA